MKKIYMQPLTEVVKINVEQMICESILKSGVTDGTGFTPAGKDDYDYEDFDSNLW